MQMFERGARGAIMAMTIANEEAKRLRHLYIGTEHILIGLVDVIAVGDAPVLGQVLKNLNIDPSSLVPAVERLIKVGPEIVTMRQLPQTPRAEKVIEYAIEESVELKHKYLDPEHLLLGLLREQDGVAAQVLMNLGLRLEDVRDEIQKARGR